MSHFRQSELIYKLEKTRADVDELLGQNKNLIYYCLTQLGQLTNQDAESAAWEALWDAIETFSPYERVQFSTYAVTCIKNAINGVLRKQLTEASRIETCELTEYIEVSYPSLAEESLVAEETRNIVDQVFEEHIKTVRGVAYDVLLYWRSTCFDSNKTTIAKACGTSVSYVGRVMTAFKAKLSSRLKGS